MSKSKLQEALSKSFGGNKPSDDPFAEAEQDLEQPHLSVVEPESDIEPEPIPIHAEPSEKPKAVKQSSGDGRFLSGMTFLMSASALAICGYLYQGQGSIQSELASGYEHIQTKVGELNVRADEFLSSLTEAKTQTEAVNVIAENAAAKADEVSQQIADLALLKEQIVLIRSDVTDLKVMLDKNHVGDEALSERVEGIAEKVRRLSAKPRQASRTERPSPKPAVVDDPTKVGGASVASIDTWGATVSVVLRDSSNNWIPLSIGDVYAGWKLREVKSGAAVFVRNSKTRALKVEA